MLVKARTFSEQLFEDYLRSQDLTNFAYEREWEGIPTRPDYTVYHNGDVYILDVKQFEDKRFVAPTAGVFGVDRYGRIREKINNARTQFKYFKDKVCCLVLYTLDPFVRVYEPWIVFGAMYGDLGFTSMWDLTKGSQVPNSTKQAFLAHGKMFHRESSQPQNQTISVLITLRRVGQSNVGAIVWENRFARKPLPLDIFCGPFDERWVWDGSLIKRVFVGDEIMRREGLPTDAGS